MEGQRMTTEHKAEYGITNDTGTPYLRLAKICLLMGSGWAVVFWVGTALFISLTQREPFLNVLQGNYLLLIFYACGAVLSIAIWQLVGLLIIKMQNRK
jgi:hypothetical protein